MLWIYIRVLIYTPTWLLEIEYCSARFLWDLSPFGVCLQFTFSEYKLFINLFCLLVWGSPWFLLIISSEKDELILDSSLFVCSCFWILLTILLLLSGCFFLLLQLISQSAGKWGIFEDMSVFFCYLYFSLNNL